MQQISPTSLKQYDWGTEVWWKTNSFLLKKLSVQQPLSLQVHPDWQHLDQFPDVYPKPEMIVATTFFEALCGFLPSEQILNNISMIPLLSEYSSLQSLFQSSQLDILFLETIKYAQDHLDQPHCSLFLYLHELYPNDPATFAPFYMHHICLNQGDGLIIPACQPHCYLHGQGVECMPPSDNIARCGMTKKECNLEFFFQICSDARNDMSIQRPFTKASIEPFFSLQVIHPNELCDPQTFILDEEDHCWQTLQSTVWQDKQAIGVRIKREINIIVDTNKENVDA